MATILASIPDCVEATSTPPVRWQESMRTAVRSSRELLKLLGLPENGFSAGADATSAPAPEETLRHDWELGLFGMIGN